MIWYTFSPRVTPAHLGFIPSFLNEDDPEPAAKQVAKNYISGWRPFKLTLDPLTYDLTYPGDPPLRPVARTQLRDETIFYYECEWLLVLQKDGSYEVSRVD